ncbi:MAG TPA: Rieske (2Fe-2S) protein [Flavobacteriales bacterium]|jgi:nitrite reductase/ring-hydroxylating ferredoxin subunit|nr:Rieske (2Fe-2S) protein [Flavobacteriales bacterium]HPH82224.1 Rieske (2Fe-2S) protein [Flavobacteriales bacterium]
MFSKKVTNWFQVFSSVEKAKEQVPLNKTIAVELGDKRICLARTEKGFFALDEKCPHQNLPITHGGICENGTIVCPFHRYAWDLKTGREVERREGNIQLYPVEERAEGLFVGIETKKGWFS